MSNNKKSVSHQIRKFKNSILQFTGNILKHAINGLLSAIASIPIGQQKRKTRPRVIKRRPKPYPLLIEPQDQSC